MLSGSQIRPLRMHQTPTEQARFDQNHKNTVPSWTDQPLYVPIMVQVRGRSVIFWCKFPSESIHLRTQLSVFMIHHAIQ